MAKPPFLNLRREDFPEVKEPWMDKIIHSLNQFGKQTQLGMSGRISISENLSAFWHKTKFTVRQVERRIEGLPSDFGEIYFPKDLTFQGLWAQSAVSVVPPRVYRLGDIGFLTGSATAANGNASLTIFKLPTKYRPRFDMRYAINYATNAMQTGFLWIRANGDVQATTFAGGALSAAQGANVTFNQVYPIENTPAVDTAQGRGESQVFPLRIKNDLVDDAHPEAVIVASSYEYLSDGRKKTPSLLSGVAYEMDGTDIVVYGIGGAVLGKTYEVTFLVLGK